MEEGSRPPNSLPIIIVAMMLALPLAFCISPSEHHGGVPFNSTIEYDQEALFERGTVFKDHSASYLLSPDVRDMAVGDLTDDGVSDVAVANRTSIFVFRGMGDGTLNTSATTITRSGMGDIRYISIGDLDGDGRDDIAASYTDSSGNNPRVTIFYQRDGFSTALDIGTYPDPQQVVIGRFNNTINNDLAVACRGDPDISVAANISLIRWPFINPWDVVQISVPELSSLQLLAGGFDGVDSRMDLVAGNMGGISVIVLTQPMSFSSAWSKRTIEVGGTITSLQMVDITGGGLRDLALINSGEDRVEVRANTGTGIPATATAIFDQAEGASSMSFGRVSGSQLPDLALLSSSACSCRLYPRQASGLDKDIYDRFSVNDGALKVVAMDNGTAVNGICVLSTGVSGSHPLLEVYYYLDGTVGNADESVFLDGGHLTKVCTGDLSFDAVVSIVDGEDRVLIIDPSGEVLASLPTQYDPCGLYIGDLDGDGVGDLAVVNGGSGSVSVYRGGDDILTSTSPDVNIPLDLLSPCSITGGLIETIGEYVLVVGCQDGIEVIFDPLSSPVREKIGTGTAGNRTDVAMGRLTSTGLSGSIAALNADTERIDIFIVQGTPTIGDCYLTTPSAWLNMVGRSPTSITVGDLDGDGREDVASGTSLGQVRLFMNSALGFYSDTPPSGVISVPGPVDRVRAGDLNDDGLDDLAVSYSTLPQVGLLLSQWPTFSNNVRFTAGGAAGDIFVGDIDGDLRDDLVATSSASGGLSCWTQRNLAPHASAWFSTLAPNEGEELRYDALNTTDSWSDRNALSYLWDFGDGTSSSSTSGHHTYAANGAYDGYVDVTDRAGAIDRVEFHIEVLDVAPTASFTFSPEDPREGCTAWFNDTSSHYDVVTYVWDFGDGSDTVTTPSATHVFLSDGTYNVTLTVMESDGDTDHSVMQVIVEDGTPVAAIQTSVTSIDEGTTAYFYGDWTSYPDGIQAYQWDFGDESPVVTTRDAQHLFRNDGSYVVTLTVWDDDGDLSVANVTMTVRDLPPYASFTTPKYTLLESENALFTDTSYAYDGIASWHWDLGDGRSLTTRNVTIKYSEPGAYVVALTITESEGMTSSFNRTITVLATDPGASDLIVEGGGSGFLMDQQVTFRVTAWQTQMPITRYAWDLEYDPAVGFEETPGATINQTSWSYRSPGEYVACVRIYDANSFAERTLTIVINNVPPTAAMTARHSGPDDLTFDGGNSQDTASDRSLLEYRWSFGDGTGWTEWGSSSSTNHHYGSDGAFHVVQEVRDRWGEVDVVSCDVTVDTTAPVIGLDDAAVITQAYLGDDLVIRVDVTDLSSIDHVLLVYRHGEENGTLIMSRIAGTDTFVATIPTLTEIGPLSFHIEAEDGGGLGSLSATMNVSVVNRPDFSWMLILGIAAVSASLILLIYYRKESMVVDEVFMIYRDGNLMAHQTRRLKPGMDDQIMGSMLVAIQDFVRDSFKDEASTGLNRMDFGEKKVLVEKGDNLYLAVVLHGKREGRVTDKMKETIEHAENRFSEALSDWDGDLDKVRGIKDEADKLLKGNVLDILSERSKNSDDGSRRP